MSFHCPKKKENDVRFIMLLLIMSLFGCDDALSGSSGLDISGAWSAKLISLSNPDQDYADSIIEFEMASVTSVTAECFNGGDTPCPDHQTFAGAMTGSDLAGRWYYPQGRCVTDWIIAFDGD